MQDGDHSDHGLYYSQSFVALTLSRKAMHVLNERGRRDRLPRAIQRLQGIIPPSHLIREGRGLSKATTVESAVDYIVALQQQLVQLAKGSTGESQTAVNVSTPLQQEEKQSSTMRRSTDVV